METVFGSDREIVFSGEIDSESIGKIISIIKTIENQDNFDEMNTKNKKKIKEFKREPIHLSISTVGGSVYHAMALIDIIEKSKTPIYTYGYGPIMSAGILIFLAGHKRYCGEYATFMFHELSNDVKDYSSIIVRRADELKRLNEILNGYIKSHTKITDKILQEWNVEREVYLDPHTAYSLDIVHDIL